MASVSMRDGTPSYLTVLNTEASSEILSLDPIAVPEIKLFPNPSDGIVYIDYVDVQNIEVYSLLGQRTTTVPVLSGQADLTELRGGTYILILTDEEKMPIGRCNFIKYQP